MSTALATRTSRAASRLVVALLLTGPSLSAAQGADSALHLWNCPYERPAPKCETYLITEMEGAKAIAPGGLERGFVTMEVGYMVNRPGRPSLGASFVFQQSDYLAKTKGFHLRARWWLTDQTAVDVAPGMFVSAAGPEPGTAGPRRWGYSAMVGVSTHYGAITTTTIVLPSSDPRGRVARYQLIGLRGGGVGGAAAAGAIIALVSALVGLSALDQVVLP